MIVVEMISPHNQQRGCCPTAWQSPGVVFIQMRRERLILHLLLYLLHRWSLDFQRSIGMPPGHFQETTRDNVEDMTVCLRLTYLAALTVGFHVGCKCHWRFEYFEASQATMVRSLVEARGQMHLQLVQVVVGLSGDYQLPQNGRRNQLDPLKTYRHLEKGQ